MRFSLNWELYNFVLHKHLSIMVEPACLLLVKKIYFRLPYVSTTKLIQTGVPILRELLQC